MRKNLMMTGVNDVNESLKAQDNINDVMELMSELRRNKPLLRTAVFIELRAVLEEKLKELQADVLMELTRSKIFVDKLLLRQKEGGCSFCQAETMPLQAGLNESYLQVLWRICTPPHILASQNIEDFLLPEIKEFTKPLFSIPTHHFLFNPGNISPNAFVDTLQLEESEYALIKYPERGTCLYKCGNERYLLQVIALKHKAVLFGATGER